jgi:hypothetical protein
MLPPKVAATKCFTALRKNISQSIVSTGYFAHGVTAFERIMPNPKG